jgi:hypothetical protein
MDKILHYAWKLSVTVLIYKRKRLPFAPLPRLAMAPALPGWRFVAQAGCQLSLCACGEDLQVRAVEFAVKQSVSIGLVVAVDRQRAA